MITIMAKKLFSFIDKSKGLLFEDKDTPVYFETRWGIHSFFMRSPIDVFILDDDYIVRKIKRNLKPWRVFFWNPKYRKVVECEGNKLKGIIVGQRIKIN